MDTERLEKEKAFPVKTAEENVPLIIEENVPGAGDGKRDVRCGESMRRFLSSPFMAALAAIVSLNGIFMMISGFRWTFALPVASCLIVSAASLWLIFADAKTKASFEPRGLLLLSISVKIQKVIFFTFSGFFLVYVFFAFLKIDILLGASGGFYDRLSSLGLWNIPIFLIIAFIIYCTHRYLWKKGMFVDNFRDAAEMGLIFGKGAAEFAGMCIMLTLARIFLFAVKPESWADAKFIPGEISSFLDQYGIGGNSGTTGLITVVLNALMLVYAAVLALIYIAKVKNFKKIKKTLDKRKKL